MRAQYIIHNSIENKTKNIKNTTTKIGKKIKDREGGKNTIFHMKCILQ
jgi:hypothetical protein